MTMELPTAISYEKNPNFKPPPYLLKSWKRFHSSSRLLPKMEAQLSSTNKIVSKNTLPCSSKRTEVRASVEEDEEDEESRRLQKRRGRTNGEDDDPRPIKKMKTITSLPRSFVQTSPPSPDLGRNMETVTYNLERADAVDLGIEQRTVFSGLICPFCYCSNRTLDYLRAHLQDEHENFQFSLLRPLPRVQFSVGVVKGRFDIGKRRSIQIGRPRTLFALENYLKGDDSWIKYRLGPQHNSKSKAGHVVLSSCSSTQEYRAISKETLPKTIPGRRKLTVPNTPRPVFNAITKALLLPGEDIPSSDEDETWFEQRHRDVVNDFTDLTLDEKEYNNRWNPFITRKSDTTPLTTSAYLPQALGAFVERNKQWLNEKPTRKREFTMHCQALVMRGVVKDEDFIQYMDTLRSDTSKVVDRTSEEEEESASETPRGKHDCICLKPPGFSHNVVCTGKACNYRYYHRECARKSGRPIRSKWLCDVCFSRELAA